MKKRMIRAEVYIDKVGIYVETSIIKKIAKKFTAKQNMIIEKQINSLCKTIVTFIRQREGGEE